MGVLGSRLGRRGLLVFGVRLEHEFTNPLLRGRISCDRTQQREAAAFTVDGICTRREGDVTSATAASLPHGEADQLQAVENAFGEMQFGIGEFAGNTRFLVWRDDLHNHWTDLLKGSHGASRLTMRERALMQRPRWQPEAVARASAARY